MATGDVINWPDVAIRVGTATLTSNSATWTTAESAALISVTAALVSGWSYRITLMTTVVSTAGALTEAAFMRIREDTATGTQDTGANISIPNTNGFGYPLLLVAEYTAGSTGNKTWVVTGSRITGATGTQGIVCSTSRPSLLTVDRIVS